MAANSIQQALDAASRGDVVFVGEGQYASGRRFLSGEQTMNRIVIDRPVTVVGAGNPLKTVIHGEWDGALNAVRCASISGGGRLSNVTLTDGYAAAFVSVDDGDGGGARLRDGVLSGCRVVGNMAAGQGGGVSARGESRVVDSVIAGNQAAGGGGLYLAEAVARSCVVEDNTADLGGGVLLQDGRLERSIVRRNMAGFDGGGVFAPVSAGASIVNCVVAWNESNGVGGGISAAEICTIEHCTIADNRAVIGSGGVVSYGPGVSASRSILFGNELLEGMDPQFEGVDLVVEGCLLPYDHPGNIAGNPFFRGPDDYHLEAGSPGIDALPGPRRLSVTAAFEPVEEDIEGVPRPLDGNADGQAEPDTGAFEFLNPGADSDGDGLLDGWEYDSGLSPVSATGDDGADGDPDGDGMDNKGEYAADTDPGNADSLLRILGITREGAEVHVVVQGGINASRTLLVAPEMAGDITAWQGVATSLPPTQVTNVLVHPAAVDGVQFYRIRAKR